MVSIAHCQDIEALRQMALLLDRENRRLHERLVALSTELARLTGQDASRVQVEIDLLKELLSQREQALFGDSSEKRPRPDDAPAASKLLKSGHGPRAQIALPVVEAVHELAADEQECPECGGSLREMTGQFEESEEITVVQREFKVINHRRKKYRCACNACVVTAPGPMKLMPGGRYSLEFAVEVAASKYLDHLPLERQRRIMAREGLVIDSQTLWDQIDALAGHLELTYQALAVQVLSKGMIHADETWWRLMGKDESKRWWVWSLACEDAVVHRVLNSRSKEAARTILGDYSGIVMADGYSAYESLSRAGPKFTLVHCWAHARRKFIDAEDHFPKEAGEALDLIGQLYAVERDAGSNRDRRRNLRQECSRPIIDQLRAWAHRQRPLPQSGLGKAIRYMLDLWPGLTAFLDDPRIPLDNNVVERGLRGVVLGRKNHYGSRSERGTEVAAIFYSLIETAKLCRVDPKEYLLRAAKQAIAEPDSALIPQAVYA
jgi:transposase